MTVWSKDINCTCLFVISQNPIFANVGETTLTSDAGTLKLQHPNVKFVI